MPNNWYVITGSPSTGKTTLIEMLEKQGYKTVHEAARTMIDNAISRGISADELRRDEKKFQENVARLKCQIESDIAKDEPVFFDRGIHDTLAYMRLHGYKIDKWLVDLSIKSTYKKVFLLDALPFYVQDYARTEEKKEAKLLAGHLNDVYIEYGMNPIKIKYTSVEERLKIILRETKLA
jgi:predicted ATPase